MDILGGRGVVGWFGRSDVDCTNVAKKKKRASTILRSNHSNPNPNKYQQIWLLGYPISFILIRVIFVLAIITLVIMRIIL